MSLALYRSLVPAHSSVVDGTVEVWLELAARRHTATAWGAVYPEAMVWWAAHQIERLPGSGASGGGASEVGVVTSQSDGDLSRTYAVPSEATASGPDAALNSTRYGQLYLELRNSRAASAPTRVSP
jgi:hypothetical protein